MEGKNMRSKNDGKVLGNLLKRKREGEYKEMIEDPRPKSWSAGHPAYDGTNLKAKTDKK